MKSIITITAEAFAVIILFRWLYLRFLLPATASTYPWYTQYLQLLDYIKQIQAPHQLDTAVQSFCSFSTIRSQSQNPVYNHCVKQAEKQLRKKYRLFKNKTVIA